MGTATTANAAAGPSVTDRAKAQMEQVSSRVQDATANPILPVVFHAWIWLFSLLSWTITASCSFTGNSDAVNFQLAVGLIFWLGIEIAIIKDKSLPFQTGSKILNRIEIYFDASVAFLAFGAACSVAGITSSICTNKYFNLNRTPDCDKLLSSNVFMWFTWLVQVIPLVIFTGPAIAKAAEAENATVLRSALGIRT